jgi:hypothetical protein
MRACDDACASASGALIDEEGIVNVLQLVDYNGKGGQLQ